MKLNKKKRKNTRVNWSKVRLIVTDFDGVWTDGKVIVSEDGKEFVICSRKDTIRLKEVKALGIKVIVISKERNSVVFNRCEKMGIECFSGIDDKIALLKKILKQEGFDSTDVLYVGDDINDLECLQHVGLPVTVADGDPKCKEIACYITTRKGGNHAMREIFDLIIPTS
jgi:N-acylneuraminate cytidylyltransferase